MSIVRWNLKEAGSEEHTNSWANLWSDEQKSHIRLCMRIRLPTKSKSNNYTESCMINEAVDNLDMDGMQQVADELKSCIFTGAESEKAKKLIDAIEEMDVDICLEIMDSWGV